MKSIITLGIFSFLVVALTSCSKEDDNMQSPSNSDAMQRSSFTDVIQPIMNRDCSNSNCHVGGSKIGFSTVSQVRNMIQTGTLKARLFANGSTTPCCSVNVESLKTLKAWIDKGSPIE